MDIQGHNLKEAKTRLDTAVCEAYNYGLPDEMKKYGDLQMLSEPNKACKDLENEGKRVITSFIPVFCNKDKKEFYSAYCLGTDGLK